MAKKAKVTPKKKTPKAPARKTTTTTPSDAKYDQPGAPWWKKFRPSKSGDIRL